MTTRHSSSWAAVLCALLSACAGTDQADAPATSAATVPATDAACRTEPTGPTEFAYQSIDGVDPNLTSLDIYLPAGCDPAPVVVWVHGGGWRRGDKQPNSAQKAAMVHQFGAALVAVNYRLSEPGSGVLWPDHGNDVAAALAWIGEHGAEHGLDPTRIALLGHSAGGHLVSIVVTDPDLLAATGAASSAIRCVVGLDSASYDLLGSPAEESGLAPNAFGTDPQVVSDASPQTQVEDNGAPAAAFSLVTRGSAGRIAGAQRFADAITAAGGDATLVVANPYSHNEVNQYLGEPGETLVTPPVVEFLGGCLAD